MRFSIIKECDRDRWNGFVSSLPHSHLYQSYEWGEVLSYDADGILRAGVEQNGHLVAVISIIKKRLPFSRFSYLYAPAGPVLDFNNEDVFRCLVGGLRHLATQHRAVFLRSDPDYPDNNLDVRGALRKHGFIHLRKNWSYLNYPRIVMRLDLKASEEELLALMRKKHRQHIHTARNREMSLFVGEKEGEWKDFWLLLQGLGRRKGFLVRGYRYFDRLRHHFVEQGSGRLLMAQQSRVGVGGVIAIAFGQRCWFLYGASNGEVRHVFPNETLHWEMIKWAKAKGCVCYDLGGTGTDYPVPTESEDYPLFHFKKGFGAQVVYLTGYYDLIFRPALYRMFRFAEEMLLPWSVKIAARSQKLREVIF